MNESKAIHIAFISIQVNSHYSMIFLHAFTNNFDIRLYEFVVTNIYMVHYLTVLEGICQNLGNP